LTAMIYRKEDNHTVDQEVLNDNHYRPVILSDPGN